MRPFHRSALPILMLLAAVAAPPARSAPVIYDTIENVAPVFTANFTTDLAALAALKSLPIAPAAGGIATTVTIYKRLPAEIYAAIEQNALPGLGIYAERVLTQARRQAKRDNLTFVVADYFARGTDPAALRSQLELAAEAICQSIDRLWAAAGGVYGAGELDRSVDVAMGVIAAGQDTYEGQLLIRFPVNEEDTGLS